MLNQRSVGRSILATGARVLLLGAIAAVTFLPPVPPTRERDTAAIEHYGATMQLTPDGELSTEERISVRMPSGKHGIFRIFDTADPRRVGIDHPVELGLVRRNGESEGHTWVDSAAGTESLRIGRESVVLPAGTHEYLIRSRTVDALEPGESDDETMWWWDVVGAGWQMTMDSVRVEAELPVEPLRVDCVMGDDDPCSAEVSGTTMVVSTGRLDPFTPVTVRVAFPADQLPPPPAGRGPWLSIVLSVLAAAAAAAAAIALWRATRERTPGFPALFEPPEGVGPAVAVRVVTERHASNDVQATLYHLADRGVLRLEGDDDTWTIHLLADPSTAGIDGVESGLLAGLGLYQAGQSFTVSESVSSGERLSKATSSMRKQVDLAAATYLHRSGPGYVAMVVGWIAAAGVLAIAAGWFFGQTGWRPWPLLIGLGVFAVISMGMMLDVGVLTKRTAAGRDLWSRAGGFSRFLTTDSAETRFEAAKHLDWYPRYLPWALAFGSADAWARRFETQGVAVPVVPWIAWSGASHFSSARMNTSFNAAITSSAAAYAASQASSGGGGFSGGSGGGGGGGGSW